MKQREQNTKAILLLSGGLDSILAGKLLLEQGIEVLALNFTSPFCNCSPKGEGCSAATAAARQLGIAVTVKACGSEYLECVKHPRFGRGSGMNPCLDCRIHLFSKARRFMIEQGAAFVASGEVLGERPMSQRRGAMDLIERESGLTDHLLRPLSAQHFAPIRAELDGVVDRSRLLAFQGRTRKPQIALAAERGITDYPCPAGGCKLTEAGFAMKFAELLEHEPQFGLREARLLSFGRHYRLPGGEKLILGRDARENEILCKQATNDDLLIAPVEAQGPTALLLRPKNALAPQQAAALVAGVCKAPTVDLAAFRADGATTPVYPAPYSDLTLRSWRIAPAHDLARNPACIC